MQRYVSAAIVVAGLAGIATFGKHGSTAEAQVQGNVLVDIHNLTPRELRSAGFVLSAPQTVQIDALGADPDRRGALGRFIHSGVFMAFNNSDNDRDHDVWPANAWITDLRTRRVVWELRASDADRDHGLRSFRGAVQLPAGTYEVYYASFAASWMSSDGPSRAASRHVEYGGPYVDDGSYHQFHLTIAGTGRALDEADVAQAVDASLSDAIVVLRGDSAEVAPHTGIALDHPVVLDVTALGEIRDDGAFDYGWIANTDTHERVWELTYDNSDPAGGTYKNRIAHVTLNLPAGHYAAYYMTDDSHDPSDWNAAPPYDPEDWGMTIRAHNAADRAAVHTFAYDPAPKGEPVVQLVRLGNDETRSQGFTLTKPLDVRIYAIGEATGPNSMDDYGWIVNLATHRRVWEMDWDNTDHAGGAQKNRMFDGVVHLEPGNYMVTFTTDGSHAYGDWNSTRPIDAEHWGITVVPADGKLDRDVVKPYVAHRDPSVLAELVGVRSDERKRATFRLDHDADVHIYAEGEGVNDEMVDYAWIESAGGRTVWELTYRMTRYAGGAEKNRLYDDVIHLPAGEYVVHYQTDDSHAYGDWNAAPPDDPEGWGITISRAAPRK